MPATFTHLVPADLGAVDFHSEFALDVLNGLSQAPKQLPSKYFYDDRGSELFSRITSVPEYYLTDCEREIFETHKARIAEVIGEQPFNLVELGAGDGQKTNLLLEHFLEQGREFHYVPVDISQAAVEGFCADCATRFPTLEVHGLVSDYVTALRWLSSRENKWRNVVLFLGSSIGNFRPEEARQFFVKIWNSLNAGDLLLCGFDLKKDIPTMVAAYNDEGGVTREFNLNLLRRINRELGGEFLLDKFTHYEPYDAELGAMRSFLVSLEPQSVFIKAIRRSFEFDAWEAIDTECSLKFTDLQIRRYAERAGFQILEHLHDSREYFADSIWQVLKDL